LTIAPGDLAVLRQVARADSLPWYQVRRARIVLAIASGGRSRDVAARIECDSATVWRTCRRYEDSGLAGLMAAPITSVKIGMGDDILILAFVIIVIGGIGSIKGAFVAAMVVGQIDIVGRAFMPDLLKTFLSASAASSAAPAISQVLIYIVMAAVLVWRPTGLFGQRT